MASILFDRIIFGPVYSRRLGLSLGINLLPPYEKVCTFDCFYCECGLTTNRETNTEMMPTREQVKNALYQSLEDMAANDNDPDAITFTGNGEPTLHPDFEGIIDDTIEVKNIFFPDAEVAVLTNSTTIASPHIQRALSRVDKAILKFDSALDSTIKTLNSPSAKIIAAELVNTLAQLDFDVLIQSMFMRFSYNGTVIDNTTEEELAAWLKAIEKIMPSEVQVYTISRDTPEGHRVHKIPKKTLTEIAVRVERLGIKTQVSA
ncbi:MAG: hypothetical protein V2I37_03095 [Marinilabiliaceae bacterium]|jgi:wyosine [tRNA(Phe)-imidazoG37] synthetase (radical SAM superfamily)|nr:hypothetical protein [Marinilabiliaceae bacterium]